MNILLALIILVLLGCGISVLLPIVGVLFALVLAGAGVVIWLLPILIIANSDKTTGGEKIAWILAIVCLSWFAWVFYFFLAPLKPRSRYYRYY